jgi:hypothetical protein
MIYNPPSLKFRPRFIDPEDNQFLMVEVGKEEFLRILHNLYKILSSNLHLSHSKYRQHNQI